MYIIIDGTTYRKIKIRSFAPEVDVTGDSLPISTLSVDVKTDDDISFGQFVQLRDDLDNLWARYWITSAQPQGGAFVHIEAASLLYLLDYTVPAHMYSAASVATAIGDLITGIGSSVGSGDYSVSSAFANATITGFCPEQSARERLQQICFVIGAYVKSFFSDKLEILPIPENDALIPRAKTYRTPKDDWRDWVTAIKIKYYTLTEGEPAATDEYVTTGNGVYYLVEEMEATVANSAAPVAAPENVIEVEKIYLINGDNVSSVLARVAGYWFNRRDIDVSIINNASHLPGDRITIYTGEQALARGYISACRFAFGMQAKGTIKLIGAEAIAGAELAITYVSGDATLSRETLWLPVGYGYSIPTRTLDLMANGRRTVYRPTIAAVTGTMTSEGAAATVTCVVALDYDGQMLGVFGVDSITTSAETIDGVSLTIGVIQ